MRTEEHPDVLSVQLSTSATRTALPTKRTDQKWSAQPADRLQRYNKHENKEGISRNEYSNFSKNENSGATMCVVGHSGSAFD